MQRDNVRMKVFPESNLLFYEWYAVISKNWVLKTCKKYSFFPNFWFTNIPQFSKSNFQNT